MTSRFTELNIDSTHPRKLAEFWCQVLNYRIASEEDGVVEIRAWEPSKDAILQQAGPPSLIFAPVPESKTVKNRLHIDVSPIHTTQDEEVRRLIALGARHVNIGQGEQSWVVLADPEGNEFCVLRSLYSGEE